MTNEINKALREARTGASQTIPAVKGKGPEFVFLNGERIVKDSPRHRRIVEAQKRRSE